MQQNLLGNIFWTILKHYWPLIFLLVILYFVKELSPALISRWKRNKKFSDGEKWRSGRDLIHWLQDLSPAEFEQYVASMFEKLGYSVEVTGASYDGGIDVIAEKNGIKHYIQCKKYITRQVPVGAVRDFYGAMAEKGTNAKGYFITTNKFTLDAEKFAETIPVELIDGSKLAEYANMAKIDKAIKQPKVCPLCGRSMILKNGKYGEFYGCTGYPECKGTQKT